MTNLAAISIEHDRDGTWDIWRGDHKLASKVPANKVGEIIHKQIAIPADEQGLWTCTWYKHKLRQSHAFE
jgi:hypothetical protein